MQLFLINSGLILLGVGYRGIGLAMCLGPVGREQFGLLGCQLLEDFIRVLQVIYYQAIFAWNHFIFCLVRSIAFLGLSQ